jgi:hypothetical protein
MEGLLSWASPIRAVEAPEYGWWRRHLALGLPINSYGVLLDDAYCQLDGEQAFLRCKLQGLQKFNSFCISMCPMLLLQ